MACSDWETVRLTQLLPLELPILPLMNLENREKMILPLSFQLISSLSSSFTTSSSSFFLFPPFFFLHFHKNLNFTNKLLFELLTKSFRNNQFLTSKSVLLRVYLQKMSSTATSTQDSYSMGWVTCYRKDPPEEMQTSRGMLPAYYCHQPMVIYIANTL